MNELFFHLIIFIIGFSILINIRSLNTLLLLPLSYFTGILVLIQIVLISLYFGYYNRLLVFILIFSIFLSSLYLGRDKLRQYLISVSFRVDAILLIILSCLVITVSDVLIGLTTDSFQYYAIAKSIYSEYMSQAYLENASWHLLHGRLIFMDILLMLGFEFSIEFFSSLFMTMLFFSVLLLSRIIAINLSLKSFYSTLLFFVIITFSITSLYIFNHTFYLHSNLTTGVFLSLGTIFLFTSKEAENEEFHMMLGFLFLASTVLIRKEMTVFSLVPISLYFLAYDYSVKKMYYYVLIYLLFAYQFWFFYIIKTGDFDFVSTGHGSQFEYIAGLLLSMLMPLAVYYFKKFYFSLSRVSAGFIVIYITSLFAMLLIDQDELIRTLILFFKYTFFDLDKWGILWFMLATSMLFFDPGDKKQKFLFLHFLLIFFIFRINLYFYFDNLKDFSSGTRMMLHIIFVVIYVIFYAFIDQIKKIKRLEN